MTWTRKIAVLVIAMMLASGSIVAQDYTSTIKSLAEMDSTLTAIMKQLEEQGRTPKQLASTDNNAVIDETDMLYSLVDNLQLFTQELQMALGDAQPGKSAAIGHGKITLFGESHQHYSQDFSDDGVSSFTNKKARLGVKGNINKYASLKVMGEFAGSPKLLDGWLAISPNKNWTLALGQQKPAFGTEFLRAGSVQPFVNSFMAKGLGTGYDIGVQMSYNSNVSKNVGMKLFAGVFNGAEANQSDANKDKNFVGRAEFSLNKNLIFAPNFIIGTTNDTGIAIQDIKTYGGAVTYKWNNEVLAGEYIQSEVGDTKKAGWNVWAGHTFQLNTTFLPAIQLLGRYEQNDSNTEVDDDAVNRLTIGTNLFIDKKYTKLQLNYLMNTEEGTSVDNDAFAVNFQVVF